MAPPTIRFLTQKNKKNDEDDSLLQVQHSSQQHFFSLNPSSPSRVNLTCQQPTNLHLPPPLPHPQHLSSFAASPPLQTPHQIRRSLFTLMASSNDNSFQWAQLNNESDFESLLTPSSSSSSSDRFLSICGFGSLLSGVALFNSSYSTPPTYTTTERSARSTFPELTNFRVAKLNGFRRVFAHVAPIFFDRGIANPQTQEISSLSVEPCEGSETLVVTVFEIKESEIPSFIEREHEFRFLAVVPETLEGSPYSTPAVLCGRYSDEEYFQIRCKGSKETYFERYGRYNINKIWRDDILPCRVYLRHCVLAAKNLGNEAYNNFLDHTFLGDRKTTIREYLATKGAGIMEEEPPEQLKSRYDG